MKTILESAQHGNSTIRICTNHYRTLAQTTGLALGLFLLVACSSRQTTPGIETKTDSLAEASVPAADIITTEPDASTDLPASAADTSELQVDQQKQAPVPQENKSTPDVSKLGQIKGILVDKESGKTMQVSPFLFRDRLETDTVAVLEEIRKYMDKIELQIDSLGAFHFTGVPYGQYVVATRRQGVVTPAFKIAPGQVVDLGKIELEK